MDTAARLAELAYRNTAWEIAVTGTDGVARLVGYSERRTKAVIGSNFDRRRKELLPLIDDSAAAWDRARMIYASATWRMGFTGRTQRQAIADGELPRLSAEAVQ